MRRMDEIYLKWPFYGSRRMAKQLRREGKNVNRKRVRRLMREMGLEAIYPKPNLSRRHPQHQIYTYLLRNLAITRVYQVWSCDITYIPMKRGHVYLVAVMDWFSRMVLSWRISTTLESGFCVEALEEALAKYGNPEIFNTDQGVQFTSAAFTDVLEKRGIKISMDGRGRCLDNVFCERLWRSLKYEEVHLKTYETPQEARAGIGAWFAFYNDERIHQALDYKTPREIFEAEKTGAAQACGYDGQRHAALPTSPQAQPQRQAKESDLKKRKNVVSKAEIDRLAA